MPALPSSVTCSATLAPATSPRGDVALPHGLMSAPCAKSRTSWRWTAPRSELATRPIARRRRRSLASSRQPQTTLRRPFLPERGSMPLRCGGLHPAVEPIEVAGMDRGILIADRPDETAFLAQRREDEGAPHAHITRHRSGRAAHSRDSSMASWRLHARSEREGAQANRGRCVTFPADDGWVELQAASRSSEAAG